jgi:hypothetical protein
MRMFVGIIFGVLLTAATAYIHDTLFVDRHDTATRPIVNWEVVSRDWQDLQANVCALGDRLHDQWANR